MLSGPYAVVDGAYAAGWCVPLRFLSLLCPPLVVWDTWPLARPVFIAYGGYLSVPLQLRDVSGSVLTSGGVPGSFKGGGEGVRHL